MSNLVNQQMELHSLLTYLAQQNVKLATQGNSLDIDAPKGVITAEVRQALSEHKSEIISLLQQNQTNISKSVSPELPTIKPAPELRYEPFPLTDMQYAFWVGRSGVLELGNVANHGYYEIETGNLDIDRLNQALQKLIERHDMLRAIVLPDGQQKILSDVPPYQMKVLDLRGKDKETIEEKISEVRACLSHQVLPADQFPLFDFRVTCLTEDTFRLHISYDLQVFDAWSLFRLFDEWFQLYEKPETALPDLEISFRDYVLAEQALQQTQLYQASQNYWLSRLDKLPPAPDLPLAKTPQELTQPQNKRYEARLNPTDWKNLQQRANHAGLTASGVLLAAFAEVLTLWSKSAEFTLNLALFNRLPLHSQVNDILGDFTSVTLLAVHNQGQESFTERAVRLQQQLWQDLEHRYFSGVRVIREWNRSQKNAPNTIPIVFTSTLGFRSLGQETSTFSHFGELVYGISQASQAWMDVQVWEEKGELTFNWDVVEELFPEGLIEDMFASYERFLKELADSESVWVEKQRQILPESQLVQINAVNATDAPISEKLLQELFTAQIQQRGESIAVISPQYKLSYRELGDRVNQVAHKLRSLNVTPNQLVAVVMEKGWEQIVAVMGILTAGAAYVPIDPSLPKERLDYLLENSQAQIILTQSWLQPTLPATSFCLDNEDLTQESTEPLQPIQTPDDLAYLIYTSGSTGTPKGVTINHKGVVNTILDINQRFHISSSDRVLALSALNFDLSVYDIFGTLAAGGTIVIPEASLEREPAHWAELILQQQVTIWNSVPALMQMMVDYAESNREVLPSLRLVLLSGDWLPLTLPTQIKSLSPDSQVISLGGATEASIWSILYPIDTIDPTWKSIPYGRSMVNQRFYVFNEELELSPVWVPGQLYISGIGLALGYWRNPEKTAASFIIHPRTGERLYRTGDLGRYLPDGTIEFLGREDFQVKIRGYRIELGEIEAALREHSAVEKAVVTVATNQVLVAYVVGNEAVSSEELRSFLRRKLPEYMLPAAIAFLDSLPLSVNGKVDRRALPHPDSFLQDFQVTYVAPQNHLEQTITAVWQEVLNLEKIGVNDNFFEIGGNSLSIAKVYNNLQKKLPNEVKYISLVDLFKYPKIRALAKYLSEASQAKTEPQKSPELVKKISAGKSRLQQRLQKSRAAQG
ncbi:MAG: amino acid adenylation domain-containing protein [Oscillatoria sp. PMC 1051.18]|nr:amino acid adenylation domain-containing protein [Oscillatoria sp. PMC 1050.18]MEC5029464.1 amino acid adenylation domain-containing protein [Oscillatoria sp. PMC 1051.18]